MTIRRAVVGGMSAVTLGATGAGVAAPGAQALERSDLPWTGATCEAAFETRVETTILLEDDVYTHPGLRVTEPLVEVDSYALRERKRAYRLDRAKQGDGTAGSGEFTLRPGQTLALLVPCELTASAWRHPKGMNDRSLLYATRVDGRLTWERDLFPKYVGGSSVVLRDRTTRGDSLYEIV